MIKAGTESIFSNKNNSLAGLLLFSMKQATLVDQDMLAEIGFTPEMIHLLEEMNIEDIAEYARYGSRYMNIHIDPDKFKQIHNIICIRSNEQQLIDSLLRANTPYRFLNEYFGLTSNEIAARKEKLRINTKPGRAEMATDSEVDRIFGALEDKAILNSLKKNSPNAYPELVLAIYKSTGIGVSKIIGQVSESYSRKKKIL